MTDLEKAARAALDALQAAHIESLDGNHFACRQILVTQIIELSRALAQQSEASWDPQCPLCGGARPAALAQQAEPAVEPVLVVEREPDYHSRGHYYEGYKSWVDPTKVWKLPIGTKLYATPQQAEPVVEPEADDETGNPSF